MLSGERIALVFRNQPTAMEKVTLLAVRSVYGPDNVRVFEGLARANQVLQQQSPAYVATVYDGSNEDFVDDVFDLEVLGPDTKRVLILSGGHLISVIARERFDHDLVMWLPNNNKPAAWESAMREAFGAVPGESDTSAVPQFGQTEKGFDLKSFAAEATAGRNLQPGDWVKYSEVNIGVQTANRIKRRMLSGRATQIL